MEKIQVSLSAIPVSLYRRFVKGWDKGRYAQVFEKYAHDRRAYRIYIPLEKPKVAPIIEVPEPIVAALAKQGYVVDDYLAGIATNKDGKRKMRIGRLLAQEPGLQKMFNEDSNRRSLGEYTICISRHPYDIASMSTNRGWTSCMNLYDGSNREYVVSDVKLGSLIAYVIKKNDKNINNPTSRLLIKPFVRADDLYANEADPKNTWMVAADTYGAVVAGFRETVQRWADLNLNQGKAAGLFHVPTGMYSDNDEHVGIDTENPEHVEKIFGYKLNGFRAMFNDQRSREKAITHDPRMIFHGPYIFVDELQMLASYHENFNIVWEALTQHRDKIVSADDITEPVGEDELTQTIVFLCSSNMARCEAIDKTIPLTPAVVKQLLGMFSSFSKKMRMIPIERITQDIIDSILIHGNFRKIEAFANAFPELIPEATPENLKNNPNLLITIPINQLRPEMFDRLLEAPAPFVNSLVFPFAYRDIPEDVFRHIITGLFNSKHTGVGPAAAVRFVFNHFDRVSEGKQAESANMLLNLFADNPQTVERSYDREGYDYPIRMYDSELLLNVFYHASAETALRLLKAGILAQPLSIEPENLKDPFGFYSEAMRYNQNAVLDIKYMSNGAHVYHELPEQFTEALMALSDEAILKELHDGNYLVLPNFWRAALNDSTKIMPAFKRIFMLMDDDDAEDVLWRCRMIGEVVIAAINIRPKVFICEPSRIESYTHVLINRGLENKARKVFEAMRSDPDADSKLVDKMLTHIEEYNHGND